MRTVHQVGIGRAKVLGAVLAMALLVGACGDDDESSAETVPIPARLDVAGGTDTPSQIVAEIYAQALENSGLRVGRKAPIATRSEALTDLGANTLQVFPDFLYSLLTDVSSADGSTVPSGNEMTDVQVATVNEVLEDTISVGDPSAADNGQVIACTAAAVEEHSLTALTDLFDKASEITLGGPAEFETASPFGLAGFAADDVEFEEFVPLEDDAIGAALEDDTIDCAVLAGLSATIVEQALIVLSDESSLAPEDVLVPLVATPALTPDVAALLSQIDQLLTTEILRSLVVRVEVGGEPVEQVAKAFIASQATSTDQ